jgi:hypothetical protein
VFPLVEQHLQLEHKHSSVCMHVQRHHRHHLLLSLWIHHTRLFPAILWEWWPGAFAVSTSAALAARTPTFVATTVTSDGAKCSGRTLHTLVAVRIVAHLRVPDCRLLEAEQPNKAAAPHACKGAKETGNAREEAVENEG